MSDDGLELDLPEDRTDFLRSLTMGVRSAKEQKAAAEKAMTTPTERMDSGGAFTQILTSVLPLVLGAAIAGKRGGMVGADVGGAANQNLFALGDKKRKEKEAMAKVKYQEASDAEKAALAKLASGTEGMIRDDNQEKNRAASDARQSKNLAQQLKIALINEGGRNSRNEGNNAWKDRDREDKQANQKDLSLLNFEQDIELQDTKLNSQEKMNRDRILASRDNLFTQIAATAERDDRKMTHEDMLTEGKYTQEEKMAGIKFTAAEKLQANKIKADLENLKTSLSSRALTSSLDRDSREKIAKERTEYDANKTDKLIQARRDNLVMGREDRENRQQVTIRQGQAERQIPGLWVLKDPKTNQAYQLSDDDKRKAADFKDAYGRFQPYLNQMRRAIASGDRQLQVTAMSNLTSKKKEFDNFGAALTGNEERITLGALPAIFDYDRGAATRWLKGQINGADAERMLNEFTTQLNNEARMALNNRKYDMDFPLPAGTIVEKDGKRLMSYGTFGPSGKPAMREIR